MHTPSLLLHCPGCLLPYGSLFLLSIQFSSTLHYGEREDVLTLKVVLKLDRPVFPSLPAGRLLNLSASVSSPGKQAAIPPVRVSVRSWKWCMPRLTQAALDNLGKKPAFPLSQFCGSETLAALSKELCAMMAVAHLLCVWCNEGLNFSLYSILTALHLNSHVWLAATALGSAE